MANHTPDPLLFIYPYAVGARVVDSFAAKHPKAVMLMRNIYLHPVNWPVILFCTDPRRWEHYKKSIKLLEEWGVDDLKELKRRMNGYWKDLLRDHNWGLSAKEQTQRKLNHVKNRPEVPDRGLVRDLSVGHTHDSGEEYRLPSESEKELIEKSGERLLDRLFE